MALYRNTRRQTRGMAPVVHRLQFVDFQFSTTTYSKADDCLGTIDFSVRPAVRLNVVGFPTSAPNMNYLLSTVQNLLTTDPLENLSPFGPTWCLLKRTSQILPSHQI